MLEQAPAVSLRAAGKRRTQSSAFGDRFCRERPTNLKSSSTENRDAGLTISMASPADRHSPAAKQSSTGARCRSLLPRTRRAVPVQSLHRDFDVSFVHFFQHDRVPGVVTFFGGGVVEPCPGSQADFFDQIHQSVRVDKFCESRESRFHLEAPAASDSSIDWPYEIQSVVFCSSGHHTWISNTFSSHDWLMETSRRGLP